METIDRPSPWLAYRQPNPQARIRLFCFPYAGGGASIFSSWAKQLPDQVEVCPVQLPGRETRAREPAYKRLASLVEVLAQELSPLFDKPFALFGHSMGALIAFELARHLQRTRGPEPVHLFVSAMRAPHIPATGRSIHHLPELEFVEAIRAFNGTPDQVWEDEDLRSIVLACLRADFELFETYAYKPEAPLDVPITAFGGWQDLKIDPNQLGSWEELTANACVVQFLPGDHFFINGDRKQLLKTIANQLGFA